jgi:hypothetical protein
MYEQMDIEYEKNSHWAERLYGLPRLQRPPSEYLREHAYWGFYEDRVGLELRHWLGVDRIIWGGDFPHVEGSYPYSRQALQAISGRVRELRLSSAHALFIDPTAAAAGELRASLRSLGFAYLPSIMTV